LRLRLAIAAAEAAKNTPHRAAAAEERKLAVDGAIALLDDPPHAPATRRALLAAIADASKPPIEALLRLAGDRPGDLAERPLVVASAIGVYDVLNQRPILRPFVAPDVFARAAEHIARAASGSSGGDRPARLRATAAALWVEAGAGFARAGEGERAAHAF